MRNAKVKYIIVIAYVYITILVYITIKVATFWKKIAEQWGCGWGLTVWREDPRRCPHVRNFYNFHIENHAIFNIL